MVAERIPVVTSAAIAAHMTAPPARYLVFFMTLLKISQGIEAQFNDWFREFKRSGA